MQGILFFTQIFLQADKFICFNEKRSVNRSLEIFKTFEVKTLRKNVFRSHLPSNPVRGCLKWKF